MASIFKCCCPSFCASSEATQLQAETDKAVVLPPQVDSSITVTDVDAGSPGINADHSDLTPTPTQHGQAVEMTQVILAQPESKDGKSNVANPPAAAANEGDDGFVKVEEDPDWKKV